MSRMTKRPDLMTDLSGKVFGRLHVLGFQDFDASHHNYTQMSRWLCKCECGEKVVRKRTQLIQGKMIHCGSVSCKAMVRRKSK